MKYLTLLFCFTFFTLNTYSQNGSLTGHIVNVNSTPIENVTIKLSEVRSDTTEVFLKGTVSDTLGKFSFKNLKASKYLLEFSHVNYDYYATEVTLKKDQAKTVTSIVLTENLYTLNEIILSGKKLPITQTADKITVNVSSNVLAAGGTPIDILKQLPIISISSEGNISIRGKRDIQILINGKPSGFAALQGQRFLDQLDLSTIEKIEVITNPSVVQSSNGAGGVINIIMKRNTKNGFNGSLNSGVGNDEWYHFSPGISYRFGKVNLFINYTLRNRKRISANVNLKQQEVANDLQLITEEQHGIRDDTRHNAEFGIDYYINENKYITFAGNYRSRNKKDTQKRTSVLSNVNDVIESRLGTVNEPETNEGWGIITQFTSSKNNNNNSTVLLDYVHSIEDETIFREELVSSSIPDFTNGIQSFYIDTNDRVLLDFEKKRQLKDSSNITYGAQAIYRKINQTFNALELNNSNGLYENIPALNDTFNYEDFISAVYFQTEKNTLKWSYQAAIRFELLNNNYTSASIDKVFKQHYFKFFPSLKLSYGFTDKTTAVFSLKKGLNRPSPNRLNPFPDISNAFNVSSGNPELLPEIFYTIETSLKTKVHKVSLTTGLFFTAYNDVIQQVTELRDDGITVRFPKNINTMYHYGIDLSLQVSPTKWWSQQIGGLFYNRTYKDDFIEASEKITYQIKSTSTVSISNSIGLQLFGNYTAPENTTQGEMGALYFFDVGLDYEFLNKKGKLSLIATDIFNSLKETSLLLNDGLSLHSNQKINSRRIYLSLSYKF